MKRFKQFTVVIIGAESAIGQAAAIRFAFEGANVVLVGHSASKLALTAKKLPQDQTWIHSDNPLTITCDIKDPKQVQTLLQEVDRRFGKINILINKLGFAVEDDLDLGAQSAATWQSAIDTDQQSITELCNLVAPKLAECRGNIINILASFNRPSGVYQNVKTQSQTLTQDLALNLAEHGIRVNLVYSNALVTRRDEQSPFATISPLDRPTTPETIAAAIAFLASNDASTITGVSLPVDGGFDISNDSIENIENG